MSQIKCEKNNTSFTLTISLKDKNGNVYGELRYVGKKGTNTDEHLNNRIKVLNNFFRGVTDPTRFNETLEELRLILKDFVETELSAELKYKEGEDTVKAMLDPKYVAPDCDIERTFEKKDGVITTYYAKKTDNKTGHTYLLIYDSSKGFASKGLPEGKVKIEELASFFNKETANIKVISKKVKVDTRYALEFDDLGYSDKAIAAAYWAVTGENPDFSSYEGRQKIRAILKIFDFEGPTNLLNSDNGGFSQNEFSYKVEHLQYYGEIDASKCMNQLDERDIIDCYGLGFLIKDYLAKYPVEKHALALHNFAEVTHAYRFVFTKSKDAKKYALRLHMDIQDAENCIELLERIDAVFHNYSKNNYAYDVLPKQYSDIIAAYRLVYHKNPDFSQLTTRLETELMLKAAPRNIGEWNAEDFQQEAFNEFLAKMQYVDRQIMPGLVDSKLNEETKDLCTKLGKIFAQKLPQQGVQERIKMIEGLIKAYEAQNKTNRTTVIPEEVSEVIEQTESLSPRPKK